MSDQVTEQLQELDALQLAELCEEILKKQGWGLEQAYDGHAPIDFIAVDPNGKRYTVLCQGSWSSREIKAAIYTLAAQRKLRGADGALLITAMELSPNITDELGALEIDLWSANDLRKMVEREPELRERLRKVAFVTPSIRPGQIRVRTIRIHSFRGIADLELTLPNRGPAVLAGINGAGKTTMLDALAVALSWMTARVVNPEGRGFPIREQDIRNGDPHCTIMMVAELDGTVLHWRVTGSRKGVLRSRPDLEELNEAVGLFHEHGLARALPVAVMYAVDRAVLEVPRRVRKRRDFDRFSAYEGALGHGTRDFRTFFEWFREREDLENERRLKQADHRDPQLSAVREAIETLLGGVSNLRVQRNPQRMVVDKEGEHLLVDQLSDGEKCLLATVGDLARRLALANPGSTTPLREYGVVLIDEIDLHLHPRWQRSVVPDLERTFPNCQFIVTTHSPQVLSEVKGETILLGRGEHGLTVLDRRSVYGWDTNRILEEFLEVDERPRQIKADLDDYFRLLQSGKLEEAEKARAALESAIGLDEPSFKKADVLMRHRRLLAGE